MRSGGRDGGGIVKNSIEDCKCILDCEILV